MSDLRTQIRTCLEETPEITLDEILEERLGKGDVRPLRRRTPSHRILRAQGRPAWVVAVAAFAGVLLLGGFVWLLSGGRDSSPVIHQPPGDTTSTTALPTTTAAAFDIARRADAERSQPKSSCTRLGVGRRRPW